MTSKEKAMMEDSIICIIRFSSVSHLGRKKKKKILRFLFVDMGYGDPKIGILKDLGSSPKNNDANRYKKNVLN